MFRPRDVTIKLALEYYKKNRRIALIGNGISFLTYTLLTISAFAF
jgi:hypothetical protein